MNDNTTTHSRRYFLNLAFKIIGAIGVLAAIYFGYHTIIDNDEPIQEIYAKAELLSKPLDYSGSPHIRLLQFELNATESGYAKHDLSFAAIGEPPLYTTYSQDPHLVDPARSTTSSNPVFSVVIQNKSDTELVISSILYRVHQVGGVKGGNYGPLSPNVKYRNGIHWTAGDQLAKLSPPFGIASRSSGSFLLEIVSLDEGVGLAWLMEIVFLTAENEGVGTETIQLIMNKSK